MVTSTKGCGVIQNKRMPAAEQEAQYVAVAAKQRPFPADLIRGTSLSVNRLGISREGGAMVVAGNDRLQQQDHTALWRKLWFSWQHRDLMRGSSQREKPVFATTQKHGDLIMRGSSEREKGGPRSRVLVRSFTGGVERIASFVHNGSSRKASTGLASPELPIGSVAIEAFVGASKAEAGGSSPSVVDEEGLGEQKGAVGSGQDQGQGTKPGLGGEAPRRSHGKAAKHQEGKGPEQEEGDESEDEEDEDADVCTVLRRPAASRLPLSVVVRRCNHEWYMQTLHAAEEGDTSMQVLLGQMLVAGYGTTKNVNEGYYWLERAAEKDKDAKVLLTSLKGKGETKHKEGSS